MKRIIAIARAKRQNKNKKKREYDSDESVSSDDEIEVSENIIGNILNKKYKKWFVDSLKFD